MQTDSPAQGLDREASITVALKRLNHAVDESSQLLETLISQINPILNNQEAVPTSPEKPDVAYNAPLSNEIAAQAMVVEKNNRLLKQMINRIEL